MDEETFAWCLFQEADADESGALDKEEVAALARNLGHPLSTAELDEAMLAMDTDGGGLVEFDEFYEWYDAEVQKAAAGGDGTGWAAQMAAAAQKYAFECIAGREARMGFKGGARQFSSVL